MRVAVVCAVLLIGAPLGALRAQERPFLGTVTDSGTGAPVTAFVAVSGTRISVSTRENGQFLIPNVPAGAFALVVRAIGYRR